jgi:hypothetical protein
LPIILASIQITAFFKEATMAVHVSRSTAIGRNIDSFISEQARRTEADNRLLLSEVNKDLDLLVNLFYTTWRDAVPPTSTDGKINRLGLVSLYSSLFGEIQMFIEDGEVGEDLKEEFENFLLCSIPDCDTTLLTPAAGQVPRLGRWDQPLLQAVKAFFDKYWS